MTPAQPFTLRTPSRVMRIHVEPWIDDRGELLLATTIYTEIESRRWRIGAFQTAPPVVKPLAMRPSMAPLNSPTTQQP
jgi:conjugal transfer pilus assembly protein TraV